MNELTFREAVISFDEKLDKGTICPCCGRFAKRYKRKITSSMVTALIIMYRWDCQIENQNSWVHVENLLKQRKGIPAAVRGDFPKLRLWGLIDKKRGQREDTSTRLGLYKITEKGKLFIKENLYVPKYAIIYNNRVIDFSEETINIREASKNRFDYAQLMSL